MSLYALSDAESQKHRILVIDRKKLRQAGIIRLLEAWADYLGLMIVAVPEGEGSIIDASCEMVILSIGGDSVEMLSINGLRRCVSASHTRHSSFSQTERNWMRCAPPSERAQRDLCPPASTYQRHSTRYPSSRAVEPFSLPPFFRIPTKAMTGRMRLPRGDLPPGRRK